VGLAEDHVPLAVVARKARFAGVEMIINQGEDGDRL